MLKKFIFTVLALLLAWLLSSLLYMIWMSGQIHVVGRSGSPSDYSRVGEHSKFVLHFALEVFGSLCAVLMLLGLGWMRDGKPSDRAKE
jgi:hypothetical protein